MADAPENTLEAFRLALSKGCRGLESDVWLSPDGEPVLHHGPPHKERTPPLALAELFAQCGTDFDLSLDMKGPGTAERTVQVAHHAGFDVSRLWLCGGSGSCAAWRQYDPDVRLVTDLRWRDALFHAEKVLPLIAEQTVDAVNLRHGRWTRRLVRLVHDAGMLAFAWDVNHRWTKRYVLRTGVDGIYSDHVSLLADLPRPSR
jgi:glycerophosphoryl diester phosphodiesterase